MQSARNGIREPLRMTAPSTAGSSICFRLPSRRIGSACGRTLQQQARWSLMSGMESGNLMRARLDALVDGVLSNALRVKIHLLCLSELAHQSRRGRGAKDSAVESGQRVVERSLPAGTQ